MRIAFHVNDAKARAKAARSGLAAMARGFGLRVARGGAADVVVALGGDGTFLHAVHAFPGVPVLGFNLGGLGYLASVGERDFGGAFGMLAAGRFKVSERSMLEVRKGRRRALALNDVVIVREMTGHAAILDVEADGRRALRYMADGIVVATPTGSTAYSLSAGGPVLMPDSRSFSLTPMNPHALAVRPVVLSDGVRLRVSSRRRVNGRVAEKLGVYADGEAVFMLGGDEAAEISKAAERARIIELEGFDPYGVLSRKLGWGK